MAFLLNKNSSLVSHLRPPQSQSPQQRGFHIDLGSREKALLADDPAIRRFTSPKRSVCQLKKIGNVLKIVIVAGACYELYAKTMMSDTDI